MRRATSLHKTNRRPVALTPAQHGQPFAHFQSNPPPMSITIPARLLRPCARPISSSTFTNPLRPPPAARFYTTKPPPFPVVPTCPSPTCQCAPTPAMPEGLEIDHKTNLNGLISNYAQHVLVCTGKDDWPSKIEDDNSGDNLAADLKELIGRGGVYNDPFHNISPLASSFPSSPSPRPEVQTTSAYILPAFKYVPFLPRVSFDSVEGLVKGYLLPEKLHPAHDGESPIHRDRLTRKAAYQNLLHGVRDVEDVVVLICGHGGRDMRCGVMGPVLRDEFRRRLPEEGVEVLEGAVEVRLDGEGETGEIEGPETGKGERTAATAAATTARVGLISHIGGHKFAGNVIVLTHSQSCTTLIHPHHHQTSSSLSSPSTYTATTTSTTFYTTSTPPKCLSLPATLPLLLLLGTITYLVLPPSHPELNPETFTPFTVTARQQVSPTAFILTVQPTSSIAQPGSIFSSIWHRGATWSVEVKQPMLQVAREYTPLPDLSPVNREKGGEEGGGKAEGKAELKFLVRKMAGGEVSGYLSGLGVGETVELRGPHYGFEVGRRLGVGEGDGGDGGRVVFLAGGTGIAPALQVVRALLEGGEGKEEGTRGKGPRVDIIWANRQRADCRGCPGLKSKGEVEEKGRPVLEMLGEVQRRWPGRVSVRCTVDEERSFVEMGALVGLVGSKVGMRRRGEVVRGCWLHDQEAVAWRPAADVDAEEKMGVEGGQCRCGSGKDLLFVSGPDGFIEHFAGPKRWANGMELQGPVGGILGKMRARYPDVMKDWLVLKL
ncbi:hypothetical protein CONLIGDRAFT_597060 [Coniochaeta ligniaria NRRL 30616]|uniref:Altered inheritance of mitochondria protein 32 n=1 Tax=Coniochaeta ligniaria NRRL 30616 TaxID=1408157 RepID=A0A1J7IRH1_9PEZI|nr:hypothetical protein CONLIGDRAFT_597060 [Coniochaeta ligniaria NRRL 30616]